MELIAGQFGFFRWWMVQFPLRIVEGGKKWAALVADVFAIKPMLQHLGESIFQDPTWQGRLIGIAIRLGRIGIGLFAQLMVFVVTGAVLILWYLLPILALWGIIR